MRHLLLLCLAFLTAAASWSSPESRTEDLGEVPPKLRQAMMQERWDDALGQLEALGASDPDHGDLWLLLTATAQDRAGQAEEALASLRRLEQEHPDSPLVAKARFRRAEIHRQRGEYEEAEQIYEEAVAYLRSSERQGELAAIYMQYADEASLPPKTPTPSSKLDYQRAFSLYAKVLDLEAPRSVRDRALYRMAVCQEKLENWKTAQQRYRIYLDEFDPSRQHPLPTDFIPGERVYQARLHLGRNELRAGQPAQARRDFEDLAEDIARAIESGQAPRELRELEGQARYEIPTTYGRDGEEARLAIAAYERFLQAFPGHPRSAEAAFASAELHQRLGELELAARAFEALTKLEAPDTDDTEVLATHKRLVTHALYMQGVALTQAQHYDEAIDRFEAYARRYPDGPDWAAAEQGIVDARYALGELHRSREEFDDARRAWSEFQKAHPLDPRAPQVAFLLGLLSVEEAEATLKRDPKADVHQLWQAAIDQWAQVARKYPQSEQASQALYRTGLLQENELGELEEAIRSYRACTFGSLSGLARERLQQMTEPSLEILTERSVRTDEPARVKVRVRNVEEVELARYDLDLETYFRKHLTHRRIEDLDLDLIDPDGRRTIAVADYRPYAPIEFDVDLETEGAGVWAVAISAGELRATTLVIRSDIDVIVKSSRREVFVFAEEMRSGTPAEGVRVLVAVPHSGGEPTLEELLTDKDGIARLGLEELESADDVRVLAVRNDSYASDGLQLSGLSIGKGLAPRAYVYTDRPAYRPGDSVHWRAILRTVTHGSYSFKEGQPVDIEIRDSQGRPLASQRLHLSAFGTVNGELSLPEQAALGQYLVQVSGPGLPSAGGTFRVERYELRKVELSLEPEAPVIYRGEEARITLSASYYYGEPVADSPLSYQLPDGRVLEGRTDSEGHFEIRFGTRDFLWEGPLQVAATLREEGVTAGTQVWLALHDFAVTVETPRPVVLAGDSFTVDLSTTDPMGRPVARDLQLVLLRRESLPGGRLREVVVETHAVRTSEEEGRAQLALAATRGGDYILQATGTDRFGNPVTGRKALLVSGDEDSVRLRLLTRSPRAKVGEELSFELVNRAGPGLALITFEGETILGYRIVTLKEGRNELSLQVGHEHFPNIRIAAAMMRGNEFYQASGDFDIERDLVVEIHSPEKIEPGEEAEVELSVHDQLGRPVRTELSLAVVDASLFDLYPDLAPPLQPFFEISARRSAGLKTSSSATFSYRGVTKKINSAVLEEAQDLRVQAAIEEIEMDKLASLGYAGGGSGGGGRRAMAPGAPPPPGARMRGRVQTDGADDFFLGLGEKEVAKKNKRQAGEEASAAAFQAQTAFWTPAAVTDDTGSAKLRFTLPHRSTRWSLTARGVSAETLLGEARASLVTRADFFVEIDVPNALFEGDSPAIAARIHNPGGRKGTVKLTLVAASSTDSSIESAQVQLQGGGVVERRFAPLPELDAGELVLELSAEAEWEDGSQTVSTREVIPVAPYGIELRDSWSGSLRDDRQIALGLPAGRRYEDGRLELYVGPSVDRMLIEDALGAVPYPMQRLGGTSQPAQASLLYGISALLESLRQAGPTAPRYADLRRRAEGLVAGLVAAQNSDGGWPWIGRGPSQARASARVALGLGRLRAVGLSVPQGTLQSLGNYLAKAYAESEPGELELRASLAHALAAIGRGDFTAVNALHRERNRLSSAGLAHTALALVAMNRKPMAAEVANLLEAKLELDRASGQARCTLTGNDPWSRSSLDMTALAAIALGEALPASKRLEAAVEFLLARRPWFERRGRGLAIAAVALYQARVQPQTGEGRVSIRVDGEELRQIDLGPGSAGQYLIVPLEKGRRQARIHLAVEGKARPYISAVLSGFTRETDGLPRTSDFIILESAAFLADTPRYKGKALPTGFSLLRDPREQWVNSVEHLEFGRRTQVHLVVDFRRERAIPRESEYLVLEVPLPAGARLVEESIRGGLGPHELVDGRLILPLGTRGRSTTVSFTLLGIHPGAYRCPPPIVRDVYRPDRMAVGKGHSLTVLDRGETSPDAYRPTPDELFARGRRLFADGDIAGAYATLGRLQEEYGSNLRSRELRSLARIMLTASLDQRDPARAVHFFEVLHEKDSEYTVPFDQVIAIGEAYRDLGEFERAYSIFRATAAETFAKDLEVAGTLEGAGELAGALKVLDELTLAYPDLPTVVQARLALADRYLTLAQRTQEDASLKRAGLDRKALVQRGVALLGRFLSLHSDSSLAPDAALALVSAVLEMDASEVAARLAGEFAPLYPTPRFKDAFLYTRAVAEWHLGQDDVARKLLRGIVAAEYPDERGDKQPSPNRDLSLYILGQIAHARQDIQTAERYYQEVAEQFPDARLAIEDFHRRSLSMTEITSARPGEKVSLHFESRNVEEAELMIYRVDLMTLYLREKDLSRVTAVNLAGIAPTLTMDVTLGEGIDLRPRESEVELDLERAGAYLVIARSGGLHASGLVLVSDLELQVSEDVRGGQVRVQALNAADGSYLGGVDVRVVGSGSSKLVRGKTDPRGLFQADGISGLATVIARHGEHYAFHRGRIQIAVPPQAENGIWAGTQVSKDAYLENVIQLNSANQEAHSQSLQKQMQEARRGVQLKAIR